MGQKGKTILTDDGRFDLATYKWDDHRFSNILTENNPINANQAMDISRFLREAISKMELTTITMPVIEKMIEAKLMEYGLTKFSPLKLDKTFFTKTGPYLSDNARTVLERRYLKKDSKGKIIETPVQMFKRVANHIAKAEKKHKNPSDPKKIEDSFYKLITEFKFLPNSPTLMNAGRRLGQLAACFVLPVNDSIDDIFDTVKNAALIHKSGGGTGFSFSRLRPKNSRVGTTGGVASGPVSFMKIFNTATEQVKQGGTRRGANMGVLSVDHPDIMEFINSKEDNGDLNNFNISVAVTDKFMEAVKNNETYDLINPANGKKTDTLKASEVYKFLVKHAWENGDPGVVFLDKMNRDNPTPELGEIESTNPCGEQPLLPMEACNLGSINLAKFVVEQNNELAIDYKALKDTVHLSVRFLDNTIDMSKYPLAEIDEMVKGNRKIGLGVMGFADLLYQLKVPYNSAKALEIAEEVMGFIQEESHRASETLAKKRGTFKNFSKSIYAKSDGPEFRNATTTTIAPTGTLSIIAGCSSGVEPLFALSFIRTVMDNDKLVEVNPHFEKVAHERGFYSPDLMDMVAAKGSISDIKEIPEDVKKVYVTAHDISPEWHVRMQAAFQKYTDNAVSKTVNLPHDATEKDVLKIYNLAYELGCKGVTIYRDGSKINQVLSVSKKEASNKNEELMSVKDRPDTLEGFTTRMKTGMGHLYVTVTEMNGKPFEVFATIGKSGKSTTAKTEAIGRLISLALRSDVSVEHIVEQIKGIGGEHAIFQKGGLILSVPDGIGRILEERYLKDGKNKNYGYQKSLKGNACPECGQNITFEEGCMTCHSCGFTKCG
ncbi:MAG: vitamin B12-dependent ribonucleotide reductase [Desulfobacterales bacterium]|nr:vitamin B12-dependent ribonucleotide reductase [Desulfobacteraceae bacterium]MBT7086965.1 vitamin B12-dependent ribonucleotide reductase [Desulfobacterales bacterium]